MPHPQSNSGKFQFNLKWIFRLTTVCAILAAIYAEYGANIVLIVLVIADLLVRMLIENNRERGSTASLKGSIDYVTKSQKRRGKPPHD